MNKDVLRKMNDIHTPLNEFLALLYENTAEDGTLYVPYLRNPLMDFGIPVLRTRMDWDIHGYEQAAAELYRLIDGLKTLAPHAKALDDGADPSAVLTNPFVLQVYRTYGVPLDDGDFDRERLDDIYDRLSTAKLVQRLRDMQESGAEMDEESLSFLWEYQSVSVTEEEIAYANAYHDHLVAEAKQRLGDRPMAYDVYQCGWRLWRLYGINTPSSVLRVGEQTLAAAFMIYRHGTEPEIVLDDLDLDDE